MNGIANNQNTLANFMRQQNTCSEEGYINDILKEIRLKMK